RLPRQPGGQHHRGEPRPCPVGVGLSETGPVTSTRPDRPARRGELRVLLGAAPGVGKTYAMLNEGRRRKSRGADVVVALLETHGREQTIAQVGDLEVVPRRTIEYQGASFTEMDLDAVLERHPMVALVDELAHH